MPKRSTALYDQYEQEAIDQSEELIERFRRDCLGAALLDNTRLRGVLLPLKVPHFKLADHQRIFRTMVELVEEGIVPFETGVLTTELLKRGRKLDTDTPLTYLESLIDDAMKLDGGNGLEMSPPIREKVENALRHRVEEIIRAWTNRQLEDVGEWTRDASAEPGADPQQIRQQLESKLADIDSLTDNYAASTKPKIDAQEICRRDMPETVFDGKLGEICQHRMKDFPLAYAWPTLLTIAGASESLKNYGPVRGNLFTCLVGPVSSGKSAAFDYGLHVLGIRESDPILLAAKYGSAEGLIKDLKDVGSCVRLLATDELSNLLGKCSIEHASFPTFLTTAFYHDRHRGGNNKDLSQLDCRLSIMGGLVEDRFEDAFGFTSLGGLYDRFLFGLAPDPHSYDYHPPTGEAELISPVPPEVNGDVWEVLKAWKKDGLSGRVAEICLRAAWVCAAVDGRPKLCGCELEHAYALAQYQAKVRNLLRPNPGQNPDAQCGAAITKWLREHAPSGEWVKRRTLSKGIHSERLGAGIFNRALQNLQFNDEILLDDVQRLVKLLPEDPNE